MSAAPIPAQPSSTVPSTALAWTGERMVPNASDIATELFHWQRYLYFRPWYEGANVVDAASGEGYGANYASALAQSVMGVDISGEAVRHATARYPHARFVVGDVCTHDYSDADLVLSFETIEHLPEPEAFLKALATCPGRIVISTPPRDAHSPGNPLADKPHNPFHTIEWTPSEFAELIHTHFPDRQVRFLSQEGRWPGLIREGLDHSVMYTIAVIGNGDLPSWPRLGLVIPTLSNSGAVNDAVMGITRTYPGEIEFAVVANGCDSEQLGRLRELQESLPHVVHLVELERNEGFAGGCNAGLEFLWQEGWFDYFGVVNDDVLPATDCLCELVQAMRELEALGHRPGLIGPVSNVVHGPQLVDIGSFANYAEMVDRADAYHREHAQSATPSDQVRGLLLLMHPECFNAVGGFDTRFGLGNLEDDDLNMRSKLAGFTSWIADGAFLYHEGSSTFRKLEIDYTATIHRNVDLLLDKWGVDSLAAFWAIDTKPEGLELLAPLHARLPEPSGFTMNLNGESIDLVRQASDLEFAAYVMSHLRGKPRDTRAKVIALLKSL